MLELGNVAPKRKLKTTCKDQFFFLSLIQQSISTEFSELLF